MSDQTQAVATTAAKAKAAQPASSQWVEQHMAFAASAKLRWGLQPPDALARSEWYNTLTPREQDLLPLVQAVMTHCLARDVSQSIGRVNYDSLQVQTGKHVLPTLLPRQLMWLDENVAGCETGGRLLLGREALVLQGFPALPFLAKLKADLPPLAWFPSESLMYDLAGNAMALPVVLAILQAGFASVTWRASVMMADETPVALEEDTTIDDRRL